MSDALIFQDSEGGNINIVDGLVETTDGLESAAYLSLYGGNEEGPEWWGNVIMPDEDSKYKSQFQRLSNGIALAPFNLPRLEEAAKNDLAALPAKKILARAKIIGPKHLNLETTIEESDTKYTENWDSMKPKVNSGDAWLPVPISTIKLLNGNNITLLNGESITLV